MPFHPARCYGRSKVELIRLLAILRLLSPDQLRKACIPFVYKLRDHVNLREMLDHYLFSKTPGATLAFTK